MEGTPGATAGRCRNAQQSVAQRCERSWGGGSVHVRKHLEYQAKELTVS